MAVSYEKFFCLLYDRGIKESRLAEQVGFSGNILTRMRRS